MTEVGTACLGNALWIGPMEKKSKKKAKRDTSDSGAADEYAPPIAQERFERAVDVAIGTKPVRKPVPKKRKPTGDA